MADSKSVSELYLSVIMTAAGYPKCFGGNSPVYADIYRNGMDNNTVANALGQFLAWNEINTLYICGRRNSHAEPFFVDLRNALDEEPELTFFESIAESKLTFSPKKIIRVRNLRREFPTLSATHRALEFRNDNLNRYKPFNRVELAAYIYCGNSQDGPLHQFECRSRDGVLCIRRRYTGIRACKVCFWVGTKARLDGVYPVNPAGAEDVDEGVVAEPLAVPDSVFQKYILEETDVETMNSDDSYESDCDF